MTDMCFWISLRNCCEKWQREAQGIRGEDVLLAKSWVMVRFVETTGNAGSVSSIHSVPSSGSSLAKSNLVQSLGTGRSVYIET